MKVSKLLALAVAASMALSCTAFAGPEMPQNMGEGQSADNGNSGEQAGNGESAGNQAGENDGDSGNGESSGEQGGGSQGGMGMPPGGGSSAPSEYLAEIEISEDTEIDGDELSTDGEDTSVVHVLNGAAGTIKNSTITKSGDGSGGDSASFYGVGATLLVSDGELYVSDSKIESSSRGGTGVFAYDNGVAYVSDVDIHTSGQNSCGGIHVAGGGTLYAWNLNVVTEGGASAAIRSDRGGGKMVIDGGSYTTQNGTGAIYCTADISVNNATLFTAGSEAMAIEGKNSIRLFDCSLEGYMQATDVNDNRVWNCIVYQSMSGDADVGTSEFDMIGGSLTCHAGPVVFNTNTSSYITFKDCDVVYGDDTTYFLQVTGNSSSRTWGKAGANGANCIFSAYEMKMEHDILYDTISSLDMYLLDATSWEGALLCDDTYNGGYSGDGIANVYIDADSIWNVAADSVITGTLYLEGTIENAKVVGVDGTVYLEGEGNTVTVGGFETTVDNTGAGQVPDWNDYAMENPMK